MSSKVITKTTVASKLSEQKVKETQQQKYVKDCLKNLENEEICMEHIEGLKQELILKPVLGDSVQFMLYKYCSKDIKANTDLVIQLAELCYSPKCVSHFSNINRFVGCVYCISSFLLKKGQYKPAVDVMSSLSLKKNEILKVAAEKEDIRIFLCNLYGHFTASLLSLVSQTNGTSDKSYKIYSELAIHSLNILKYINTEQCDVGKKVLKTSLIYLQTVKCYKEEDILEYYNTLKDVLKVLLPQMEEIDYLLFFVFKMNQFKNSDLEKEVYPRLRKTACLLTLFLGSSSVVVNILYKMLDFFFFCECCENKLISEKEHKILCSGDSQSLLHFILASSIVNNGLRFLRVKFEKSWYENISVEFVEKLSKSVMEFHESYWRIEKLYCCSVKKPFPTCFLDLLTGNLHEIQFTIRLCLKSKIPNALSLVPLSRKAFELSMECLEYIRNMGCCQEHSIYSWKFSVIHHTNTVEDICRLASSDESWNQLKDCAQEILREIVNSNEKLPFEYNRIKVLFQRWHTACVKLKNYQQALYVCLVYYVLYPKEEKDIMAMWLQTKSESSNEIIEEIIMSDMLKTCDKTLKEFYKSYDRSKVCLKTALLLELKAYSTCAPDVFQNPETPYQLAIKIWKLLQKWKLNFWETSVVMSSFISVSNAGDKEKLPTGFLEKCEKHIDDLINSECKENKQCGNLLHAGNLMFSLFLYNVKTAERSEGRMDTTHMVLGYLKKAEEEKVKFGEDVDVNLICDVIPSSKHLTVELETNYLNELNKIVDFWGSALKSGHENPPLPGEFDLWLRNVKQVAHFYELIGEYQRAFTTWLLFYRIGKLSNNSGAILLGLTRLVENCADVDESVVKEEAEIVFGKLGSELTDRYVLVEYSLTVAANYLKNKKPNKCLEYLSLAKKNLFGLRTTITTYTLNAKFWCLVSQFLVVYREYEAVFEYPPGTDARVMAFKAFSYANGGGRSELIKSATQSECTELVLAMLHINLWAYDLHWVYRQTDFMRFFLDDLYQIVQKLFLPTRTAEILVRLAEVDMICEKRSDCQEKILKLKSILTTLSPSCKEIVEYEKQTSPYLSVPQGTDSDVPGLRPISPSRFLDGCPQPKELDVSPIHYYLSNVKSSKAKEHVKKCKCRLCQNLLIQILTFDTIWLEGEMRHSSRDLKQAAKCYSQACDVLNNVEHVRGEQSKILRCELSSALNYVPGELDFKLAFVQFHSAKFLIKYALFEASGLESVTENVNKTILRISKLMKKFSFEEKLLQWTFAELKLYCVVLNKGIAKPPRSCSPVAFKSNSIVKTPVGVTVYKTPAPTRNKNMKSPQSSIPSGRRRTLFVGEESPTEPDGPDRSNGASLESEELVLHSRKLNFLLNEPEENAKVTKTVKKVSKEKMVNIQSRKLDFDLSADLFEEPEGKSTPVQPLQKRAPRSAKKTAPPSAPGPSASKHRTTKSEIQKSVKIYLDPKDDVKSKKTGTKSLRNKTKKP